MFVAAGVNALNSSGNKITMALSNINLITTRYQSKTLGTLGQVPPLRVLCLVILVIFIPVL